MLAAGARSLADVMAAGPLPLPTAVAYARGIAAEAAVFHREGRAHGALAPAWIMVGPAGPALPQPSGTSRLATPASDLHDFGLLLHQMLTGHGVGEPHPPALGDDILTPSPETVRAAALRLAERCRRAPGQGDLRRVSTELRLFEIMMNSFGSGGPDGLAPDDGSGEDAGGHEGSERTERAHVRMCPSCGSFEIYAAQRLTVLEKVLSLVDLKTYRCYGCFRRFINVLGLLLPRPETH